MAFPSEMPHLLQSELFFRELLMLVLRSSAPTTGEWTSYATIKVEILALESSILRIYISMIWHKHLYSTELRC